MIGGGSGFTGTRQFGRGHLCPVADAAAGLDVISRRGAGFGATATGKIQLIVYNQPGASAFGQRVVLRLCSFTLGVIGQNRQLRLLQVVMQGHQAIGTAFGATAQGYWPGQQFKPFGALCLGQGAVLRIGETQ